MWEEGKRDNHNITPFLYPKLRRRITYEWCESEVNVGGDGEPVMLAIEMSLYSKSSREEQE